MESGLLPVSAASRKHQISGSVIDYYKPKIRELREETMTERPPSAIEAELDAGQKRLSALESIQEDGAPGSARMYRRGFSKGVAFGLAPFIGVLLLIGGTLYAQSGADAPFSRKPKRGPSASLPVQGGRGRFSRAAAAGRQVIKTIVQRLWAAAFGPRNGTRGSPLNDTSP